MVSTFGLVCFFGQVFSFGFVIELILFTSKRCYVLVKTGFIFLCGGRIIKKKHMQIKFVGVLLLLLTIFLAPHPFIGLFRLVLWVFPVGLAFFTILAVFFARWSIRYVGNLEQECYFFEYRKQVFKDQKRGKKYKIQIFVIERLGLFKVI